MAMLFAQIPFPSSYVREYGRPNPCQDTNKRATYARVSWCQASAQAHMWEAGLRIDKEKFEVDDQVSQLG